MATISAIAEQDELFTQEKGRLDQALPDDLKKKKQIPTKKKAVKPKPKVKKQEQVSSTDTGASLFSNDFTAEVVEQVTLKQEKETLLQLDEDEEIEWESDLDVDVILNKKVNKDAYLTACEALNVIPLTIISKNLNGNTMVLPYHGIGPVGARALGKVLESNSTIETLDLANNGIDFGGQFFGLSLCHNHTITFLNLANNNLKTAGVEIAAMIGDNRTIKTLILSGNRFGDNEAKAIAEGLRQNDSIQNLDLSRNEIGDIGGIALGSGIQANGGLQDLNLAWNHMRPKGVTAILQGSKDNSNLVSLNISHNGIGDQANVLADFLAKTQLNKLDISYTRLSDQSGGPMLKGLDANRSIQELDISGNSFGSPVLQNLFKILPNTRVTNLIMKELRVTKELLANIESLRQDNNLTIAE